MLLVLPLLQMAELDLNAAQQQQGAQPAVSQSTTQFSGACMGACCCPKRGVQQAQSAVAGHRRPQVPAACLYL